MNPSMSDNHILGVSLFAVTIALLAMACFLQFKSGSAAKEAELIIAETERRDHELALDVKEMRSDVRNLRLQLKQLKSSLSGKTKSMSKINNELGQSGRSNSLTSVRSYSYTNSHSFTSSRKFGPKEGSLSDMRGRTWRFLTMTFEERLLHAFRSNPRSSGNIHLKTPLCQFDHAVCDRSTDGPTNSP